MNIDYELIDDLRHYEITADFEMNNDFEITSLEIIEMKDINDDKNIDYSQDKQVKDWAKYELMKSVDFSNCCMEKYLEVNTVTKEDIADSWYDETREGC